MPSQCTHILANGEPCHASATTGSSCCRHHDPKRPLEASQEKRRLVLPPLVNKSSILSAVVEVLRAMSERRIKRSEGGTFLYGLQFAATLMTDVDPMAANSFPGEPYETQPTRPAEPQLSSKPEPVTEFGRMRQRLEAQGHVFFTPTPEDNREMMALLDKGKIKQLIELYMAKHSAWERSRAENSRLRHHHAPMQGGSRDLQAS